GSPLHQERILADPGPGRGLAGVPVLEAGRHRGRSRRLALRDRHLAGHGLHEAHQGLPDGGLVRLRVREVVVIGRPSPDAGFSVVLAVFSILILLTLGIAMVSMVVEDSDLSVVHVRENQAFYAAHAGVEYAVVKLSANWSWGGLASPGKNVGAGSFWIAPPDAVDENGNALPAGRKRIVSNGVVG